MKTNLIILSLVALLGAPAMAQVDFDSSSGFDLKGSIASAGADIQEPVAERVVEKSANACEGYSLKMRLRGRSVTLPASGLWTLESHLATKEDSFPNSRSFPRNVRENIPGHIAKSCDMLARLIPGTDCGSVYDSKWAKEWTPPEHGKAGQGAVSARPSAEEEMWIFNMMWSGKAMPKPGTKFLASFNGKNVVVVGGYERGPSSKHFLGGFQKEVLWALGATEDSSRVKLSTLSDQNLPPGPIKCPQQPEN